ncbi:MAG: hypothetical protein AAF672_02905 [Pseudomonadota bacterium]
MEQTTRVECDRAEDLKQATVAPTAIKQLSDVTASRYGFFACLSGMADPPSADMPRRSECG